MTPSELLLLMGLEVDLLREELAVLTALDDHYRDRIAVADYRPPPPAQLWEWTQQAAAFQAFPLTRWWPDVPGGS